MLFVTAVVHAVIRWALDTHLVALGAIALGAAAAGRMLRRRGGPRWVRAHIVAMATSYAAMLTAFYVDNGPQLPLWNLLPPVVFWVLPSLVAMPIVAVALARHRQR